MRIQTWGCSVQIYKIHRFIYGIICADKYNSGWNWESVSQKQAFQLSIQRLQGKWRFPPSWHLPSTYLKYKGSRQLTSISKQRESKKKERKVGNTVLRLLHAVNAGIRRGSAAARLPGLRVRIPPGACCECCVLLSRGLQGSPTDCGAPFCVL